MRNRLIHHQTRVTATDGEHHWVYVYQPSDWRLAVRRILKDRLDKKLPVMAAAGLVKIVVEEAASEEAD